MPVFLHFHFGLETALLLEQMTSSQAISRRGLFWLGSAGAASVATSFAVPAGSVPESVLHFASGECEVQMSVQFFDRYRQSSLQFSELFADRRFCLSASGQANTNCLANFSGSLAIARYQVRKHVKGHRAMSIREAVRTIDGDARIPPRAPFERTIEFEHDVASDIQVFGVEGAASSNEDLPREPWCILRQDLYLSTNTRPFLIVHWKHTLSAIRLLDVIPGDETRTLDAARR
jgi:hypothetical protein